MIPFSGEFLRQALKGRVRALVIGGSESVGTDRLEKPLFQLRRAGFNCIAATTSPTPWAEPADVDKMAEVGRRAGVQFVVGAGGGTVLDTAKAVAAVIPTRKSCSAWAFDKSDNINQGLMPLPLVMIPTTVSGGLAAGSPRSVVHVLEEQMLSAPRWNGGYKPTHGSDSSVSWADPHVFIQSMPEILGNSAGYADNGALSSVVAATIDLLLAQQHFSERCKNDDNDDDDDVCGGVAMNFGEDTLHHEFESAHAVTTRRLAAIVAVLEDVLAAQRGLGPRPAPPPGSSASSTTVAPLDLGANARGQLLNLAVELGALAGQQRFDRGRLLLGSAARALHTKHFPTTPHAKLHAALLPSVLAQAMLTGPILGPDLIKEVRALQPGNNHAGQSFDDSCVVRWVASDLPDLRAGGGVGSGTPPILSRETLTAGQSAHGSSPPSAAVAVGGGVGVVSASGVEDMLASLKSATSGAEPLASAGAEIGDLCPPAWLVGVGGGAARRKEVNRRLTEILSPFADPFAATSDD